MGRVDQPKSWERHWLKSWIGAAKGPFVRKCFLARYERNTITDS
jgi:hypothetical protein